MRTKITRVLQIGDVHLPDWPDKRTDIDLKDKEFSTDIIGELTEDRLSLVLRAINKISNSGAIDAVALMGDYTSKGQVEKIRPAVEILSTILQDAANQNQPKVFGVPGNHDVSRTVAAEKGPVVKFDSVRDAFKEFSLLDPPVEDCLKHEIDGSNEAKLDVYLLNTSIGSMSIHLLPEPLTHEFSEEKLSEKAIALVGQEPTPEAKPEFGNSGRKEPNRLTQLYNQLDTPYVSSTSLDTLLTHLDTCERDCVFICAHHNILPQRVPRISPYSEMLNAGLLRSHLLRTGKNIVYLHGHIHEDPVERIVRNSAHGTDQLDTQIICISAPPIWEGFNEIAFFHNEDNDVFLVRLTEYRPDTNGRIGNFTDQRTSFFPLVVDNSVLMTKNARQIWDRLRDSKRLNWREAVETCSDLHLEEDELEHLFLLLFCAKAVEIVNLGKPRNKWRIISLERA